MNRRWITMAAMLALLAPPQVQAAPPASVQAEVNLLLGFVERSGCEFERNGSWHGSLAAQEHLRAKYDYLATSGLVQSTEQFIEKAATESSLSGKPYRVRCNGNPLMTSQQWLRDELARLRSAR